MRGAAIYLEGVELSDGDWNVYLTHAADWPAAIAVDLQYEQAAPGAYSTLAILKLTLKETREDGLPQGEEIETIYATEDRLVKLLNAGRFVGHKLSAGTAQFFFYTQNSSAAAEVYATIRRELPDALLELSVIEDAAWSVYRQSLLPKGDDIQGMWDNRVVQTLSSRGDNINTPRIIDHYAYFHTAQERDDFKAAVLGDGFQIGSETLNLQSDAQWSIRFNRMDAPSGITAVTVKLTHLAEQHNGKYDGWESPAISGQ